MQAECEVGLKDLNAEASKTALAVQCRLLDDGFCFEDAAAVALAVMPSIRHMLTGAIAEDSSVIVVPGPGGLVKLFESESDARSFSESLAAEKILHIGVNLAYAKKLSSVYGGPAHECAVQTH